MSTNISPDKNLIERLFNVGAHFGFSKSRRHPTVKPYLFGNKQGTDIFDLEKTVELIETAKAVLKKLGEEGKTVLFVGTKEEASVLLKDAAIKVDQPYAANRWIGGMLTNWSEIKKRIARLHNLTEEGESGELERKYTKKERVVINRELEKLTTNFGGVKAMEKIPDLLLIVDPRHEVSALAEAKELKIPVMSVMSSDNNVSDIDYPVLVNDALQGSLSLVLDELVEAYKEGKAAYVPKPSRSEERSRR